MYNKGLETLVLVILLLENVPTGAQSIKFMDAYPSIIHLCQKLETSYIGFISRGFLNTVDSYGYISEPFQTMLFFFCFMFFPC